MLYECTVKIRREVERPSTLPPPCYHCKPPPFRCPSNGCLPPEPQIPKRSNPCPPCILLVQAALNVSKRDNVIDGGSKRHFFSYLKLITYTLLQIRAPEEKRTYRWTGIKIVLQYRNLFLQIYKPRPICVPPPTICIATACKPPTPRVYCQPPPKLLPPPSGVQFCVNYTDTGFGCYHPSYWSSLSKCDTC
jgi:hypothetical protein